MVFRRKIYDKLLEWKKTSNGKTAILIEGARRVGKSTITRLFAENEYESYILIDFYRASDDVIHLFDDLSDLDYIFLQLQLIYHVDLVERKSLIVFDEVQLCPKARQAIKALVEDRRYDYIETGSLISIKKNVKDILIPSEERRMEMFPMDYEEFCWALGDTTTIPMLKQFYETSKPLGQAVHRKQMRNFRLYMLIGGMPQAVDTYLSSNNFKRVDEVKRDILNLYENDFRKIDPTGKISMLFDAIPAQLSGNASRYNVSSVFESSRATDMLEQIADLESSKTVLLSYHANDPNSGLAQNIKLSMFKMFIMDTGLFITLAFKDRDFTENIIYEKLLNDKLPANLGYVYENIIAQTFVAKGRMLYYHTFLNPISRHNYEVDFLLTDGAKICPVEVKSSTYKTHASLDAFSSKYSSHIKTEYLLYTKDYQRDGQVNCLPMYMAQFL